MKLHLRQYLPFLDWIRDYQAAHLRADLVAAVTVSIMVIPQSLAFALLAGLPPQAGLYASILPSMAYAFLGTSQTLAVGPVALISLMSAATVSEVAQAGTADYGIAAIYLALISGIILLVMGVLRLGFLSNFISHPVISGFITASGLLIAANQLSHLLGMNFGGNSLPQLALSLWQQAGQPHLPTLVLGVTALVFLYLCRYHMAGWLGRLGVSNRPKVLLVRTGPLLAVVVSTVLVAALHLDRQGVAVVGNVPAGLPLPGLPESSWQLIRSLLLPALLISVVIFVESVSLAHKLAARRDERIDPDQELLGLGAANVASAFSGGFAVAGGFSRSVINFDSGARTPAAGAYTAIFVALVTLFFTPLFYYLPIAVLAATIIIAVLSLVDLTMLRETWAYSRQDGTALLGTLTVTLLVGVTEGIVTGVILSLGLYLWRTSRPHSVLVGRIPESEHFRSIYRHDVETDPKVMILRVDESLYFANARYLEDLVYTLIREQPQLTDFVLMCPAVNTIDVSALETLESINGRLRDANIRLHLSEVKGPVMDRLESSTFLKALSGQVFLSTYQAWCTLHQPDTGSRS